MPAPKKNKSVVVIAAFCALLVLFILGNHFLFPPEKKPEEAVIEPGPREGPDTTPPLSPYTGLPVEEELLKRPLAVMIDNHHNARPQYKLQDASYVYEIIAEGGITRFLAVFHHKFTGIIGPIRSIRPYYAHLARENDALVAHCGSSVQSVELLRKNGYDNLDEQPNPAYFFRERSLYAPHNLFTDMDKMIAGGEHYQIYEHTESTPIWKISNAEAEDLGPVTEIEINFSNYNRAQYRWDEAEEGYRRFINDEPHVDGQDDRQLIVQNIIVQYVPSKFISNVHREYSLVGSGEGLYISNGHLQDIRWSKDSFETVTRFTLDSGLPLKVSPGHTWIHILAPASDAVTVNAEEEEEPHP